MRYDKLTFRCRSHADSNTSLNHKMISKKKQEWPHHSEILLLFSLQERFTAKTLPDLFDEIRLLLLR